MSEELEQLPPQDETATAASTGKKIDRSRTRSPRTMSGGRRKRLTIYVSDEEDLLLRQTARMRGVSLSKFMVDNALHDLSTRTEQGTVRLLEIVEELRWFRRQLQGIATNLNQVAYYANSDRMLPPNFAEVHAKVEEIIFKIDDALNEVE